MPTAKINGVNIYYESHGEGFPLALAYGLGGSTVQWEPQVEALSQRYRLILWDPRGHGGTDSPPDAEDYGQDISAEDLNGLLGHLGIQEAYVGGLSMGGGIAVRFAAQHPQRTAALLIFDSATASGRGPSAESRRVREEIIRLAETEGMAAVAEFSIKHNPNVTSSPGRSKGRAERIRRMYTSLNPVGYANNCRMLLKDGFDSSMLERIDAPTLVLAGDKDPALPACRWIHGKIRGSRLVVIRGAGHLSNRDQAEAFNEAVLEFLAGVDAARGAEKLES